MEITILKCRHYGEDQARKLLPYIESCDVYSPEAAHGREVHVAGLECEWRETLKDPRMTRTAFRKGLEVQMAEQGRREQERDYMLTECDYIYTSKRPVWYVERFGENEANRIRLMYEQKDRVFVEGLRKLHRNDINGYIDSAKTSNDICDAATGMRDDHIRRNLMDPVFEGRIRKAYPELQGKATIKLVVSLGATHMPEKGMVPQPEVVRLYPECDFPALELRQLGGRGYDDPEIQRQLIGAGALMLLGKNATPQIKASLRRYSLQEMTQLVSNLSEL